MSEFFITSKTIIDSDPTIWMDYKRVYCHKIDDFLYHYRLQKVNPNKTIENWIKERKCITLLSSASCTRKTLDQDVKQMVSNIHHLGEWRLYEFSLVNRLIIIASFTFDHTGDICVNSDITLPDSRFLYEPWELVLHATGWVKDILNLHEIDRDVFIKI